MINQASAEDWVTSSNGAEVPMPQIDALACDEMISTLRAISGAGYRGTMPIPVDHPDYPIYEYENRLAVVHFEECQDHEGADASPRSIFSAGFN